MDIDDLLLEDEWFKNETNQYTDEKRLKTLQEEGIEEEIDDDV